MQAVADDTQVHGARFAHGSRKALSSSSHWHIHLPRQSGDRDAYQRIRLSMVGMNIARFLMEVSHGARAEIPVWIDPIGIILTRIGLNPNTPESRSLRKATLALIARE